jgi:hypothetical protein
MIVPGSRFRRPSLRAASSATLRALELDRSARPSKRVTMNAEMRLGVSPLRELKMWEQNSDRT